MIEVLPPWATVPAAVARPKVVDVREDVRRMALEMKTRAGQRFLVGFDLMHDLGPLELGAELNADFLLDEALKRGKARWKEKQS